METTNNKTERAPGYYWVLVSNENYEICHWTGLVWERHGNQTYGTFHDEFFADIEETPIVREPEKVKESDTKRGFPFKLPCKYDQEGQIIFDADGRMMLDVRGWGYIQYLKPNPEKIQDDFAQFVVDSINGVVGEPLVKGETEAEKLLAEIYLTPDHGDFLGMTFWKRVQDWYHSRPKFSLPLDTDTKTKE